MKTVYVGMSGGVDSSVAALLLKEQGYHVVGVYMKNWSQDLPGMKCPWAEDLADAKRVAVKLGIDFYVWDFEKEYREKVVEYMLREFRAGNTPNPDIICNQEIKFKLFYEKAMEAGADFIATGHYARVGTIPSLRETPSFEEHKRRRDVYGATEPRNRQLEETSEECACTFFRVDDERTTRRVDGREGAFRERRVFSEADSSPKLLRALDENKDQTYFLYRISEEALAHTLFPIGDMTKPEVKKLAKERGLHNAYKKESMGVCFVGEVGMKDFLKEYIDIEPGEIREIESEKVLGYHEGAVFYTIGQRHGLYLNGEKGAANDGLPYYVVKKDINRNIIYVSKNLNDSNLWAEELKLQDIVLRTDTFNSRACATTGALFEASPVTTGASEKANELKVSVRLRHRAPLVSARFDGESLYFEKEIKRPAAGQSAVLYNGEVCVGGGIIAG